LHAGGGLAGAGGDPAGPAGDTRTEADSANEW
jgi:hypothetical protein